MGTPNHDHPLALLDGYLAELQSGRNPDRAKLLAEHPELAAQLEQCLSGMEFIHRASASSGTPGVPPQLGDFRIVREVGRGGMGVEYEAEQISLKRGVALKVLRFGAAADAEAMQLEAPGIVSFLKLPEDKEAWKVLPAQTDVFAWQQVLEWFKPGWWRNGAPPRVVRPMRDLNGDGVEDVIWSAPQSAQLQVDGYRPGPSIPNPPVLLSASGKDGQPLWFRPQDSKGAACRLGN